MNKKEAIKHGATHYAWIMFAPIYYNPITNVTMVRREWLEWTLDVVEFIHHTFSFFGMGFDFAIAITGVIENEKS